MERSTGDDGVITLEVDNDLLSWPPPPSQETMPQWRDEDNTPPVKPLSAYSPRSCLASPATYEIQDDPDVHTSASVLLFTFPTKHANEPYILLAQEAASYLVQAKTSG